MSYRWELHLRRVLSAIERLLVVMTRGRTASERLEACGILLGMLLVNVGLGCLVGVAFAWAFSQLALALLGWLPWLMLGSLLAFCLAILDWLRSL